MSKQIYNYSWGSWKAEISKHSRRDEYIWSVEDADGNDTYDFYSEDGSSTPEEAENDMFNMINDKIGHSPERQIIK